MKDILVIVESPSKAKTIKKYLGKGFEVVSSKGHIRDLPSKNLGVKINGSFEPEFVTLKGKESVVKDLKRQAAGKAVLLASDMDREGEAIAWHIARILDLSEKEKNRVVFSEITKSAIQKAVETPSTIQMEKVEAQFARRILDRLVGYQISPFLWRVMRMPNLSAGRVQSVALRFLCDLEEKITRFEPKEYWRFTGFFAGIESQLVSIQGKSLDKNPVETEKQAMEIKAQILAGHFSLKDVQTKTVSKKSPPPYITSSLQQDAATRIGFSVSRTMRVAQELYEGVETPEGQTAFITYMRTDSTRLSEQALDGAKDVILAQFGEEYFKRETYQRKKANVQDAHEAIRPTYPEKTPQSLQSILSADHWKLYSLIWSRFMASQMSNAKYSNTKIKISDQQERFLFEASGSVRIFDGFEKVYPSNVTEKEFDIDAKVGDGLELQKLDVSQHFTNPPPRFTEASLVKKLEKEGIGRPSTYASIIRTLLDRKYASMEGKTLFPSFLGIMVNRFLTHHFPKIIQTRFTASMEDGLDQVEMGQDDWQTLLKNFYGQFEPTIEKMQKQLDSKELYQDYETNVPCPSCGKMMTLRMGKYGPYLTCTSCTSKKNISVPEKVAVYFEGDKMFFRDVESLHQVEEAQEIGRECPKCGSPLVKKIGRFGPFIACSNYPDCKYTENIDVKARGKCPDCGSEVVMRRSRKGKVFYTCKNNEYNGGTCTFISWNEPSDESCPTCGKPLFYKFSKRDGEHLYCPECKVKFPVAPSSVAPSSAEKKVPTEAKAVKKKAPSRRKTPSKTAASAKKTPRKKPKTK